MWRCFRKIRDQYPVTVPYISPVAGRRREVIPSQANRIYIPLPVMEATDRFMRDYGNRPKERYVWWGGYFTSNGNAQVVTAICADIATGYGRIQLSGKDLQKLQHDLRSRDQILIAELHTHPPGAGGQNNVDAENPAATYPGFISIIVPNFSEPHFYDLRKCYVYEYRSDYRWRTLSASEIEERFVVELVSHKVRL